MLLVMSSPLDVVASDRVMTQPVLPSDSPPALTVTMRLEMCERAPTPPSSDCFDVDRHGDNLGPHLIRPHAPTPFPTNPNTAMFVGARWRAVGWKREAGGRERGERKEGDKKRGYRTEVARWTESGEWRVKKGGMYRKQGERENKGWLQQRRNVFPADIM